MFSPLSYSFVTYGLYRSNLIILPFFLYHYLIKHFLLIASGRMSFIENITLLSVNFRRLRTSLLSLTDRNWSVAEKVGKKNLAGTLPHARVPSPKFGEINCENPFACENSISRALGPVLLHLKHTQNAKIILSRPPEWVWPAAAGHIFSL